MRGYADDPKDKIGFETEIITDKEDAVIHLSMGRYKKMQIYLLKSENRQEQEKEHI